MNRELGLIIMLGGVTLFLTAWAIYYAIQDRKEARHEGNEALSKSR